MPRTKKRTTAAPPRYVESFGPLVRKLREQSGLTIQRIATDAECSISTLCGIESGRSCEVGTLARVLAVLGHRLEIAPAKK
jgi:transcriptional regulator with XRE-family HTH domain